MHSLFLGDIMSFHCHPEKIAYFNDNDPCGVGLQNNTLAWCSHYDGEKYPTELYIYSKNAIVLHIKIPHFLKEAKG